MTPAPLDRRDAKDSLGSGATKIKICGLTRVQDVELATELGADALGFIFAPESARCVSDHQAQALVRHAGSALTVGVFVDRPPMEICRIAEFTRLAAVQLHGRESNTDCIEIRRLAPHLKIIKAFRVHPSSVLTTHQEFPDADHLLFDFNPSLDHASRGALGDIPSITIGARNFLAGNVSATSVGELIRDFKPYAVDLARGVESTPGLKDPQKMRAFFQAVAQASTPLSNFAETGAKGKTS